MKKMAFLITALAFLGPAAFTQSEHVRAESYSAVAVVTGGPAGGRMMPFSFQINRFTTDDEVRKYADLLKSSGQDALLHALEDENVGRIARSGSVGNQIAVARKHVVNGNTIITIVTARRMSFIELFRGARSTDYPFGYLRVTLDSNGKGSGQIIIAAKIRFDRKRGRYEIESYGPQYVKAVHVRLEKY